MRILLTNDDGITAPGLAALEQIAREIAGPEGEIWTIAPALEQSGVGHCVSYVRPAMLTRLEERRFALDGAPADCVLAALHHVMPKRPDLILSGVNRDNNAGENALYSGTLGAAMEGALQGVRAIALSAFIGPDNAEDIFAASVAHGAQSVRRILADWPEGDAAYALFWNVNFPPCAAEDVTGMAYAAQGYRGHGRMRMTPAQSPNRRTYLWISSAGQEETGAIPDSDLHHLDARRIAAVPMRADLTCQQSLAVLPK